MSEKELRDALSALIGFADEEDLVGLLHDQGKIALAEEFDLLVWQAKDALADAGEPEMVTLLRWLRSEYGQWNLGDGKPYFIGRCAQVSAIIRHIEDTFGYTLEEGSD